MPAFPKMYKKDFHSPNPGEAPLHPEGLIILMIISMLELLHFWQIREYQINRGSGTLTFFKRNFC